MPPRPIWGWRGWAPCVALALLCAALFYSVCARADEAPQVQVPPGTVLDQTKLDAAPVLNVHEQEREGKPGFWMDQPSAGALMNGMRQCEAGLAHYKAEAQKPCPPPQVEEKKSGTSFKKIALFVGIGFAAGLGTGLVLK